jgi:hypothetical protein
MDKLLGSIFVNKPVICKVGSDFLAPSYGHRYVWALLSAHKEGRGAVTTNTAVQTFSMIIHCCGRAFKPRTQIQILIATIVVLLLAILVPLLAIHNNRYSERKSQKLGTGRRNPLDPPTDFSGVLVMANVTTVDTVKFETRVRYLFFPLGEYDAGRSDVEQFSSSVTIITNGKRSNVTTIDLNPADEATYVIATGDPNQYPFDRYTAEFFLAIKDGDQNVPIMFGIVGNVMGWSLVPYVIDLPGERIGVHMVMSRGMITKFFSIVYRVYLVCKSEHVGVVFDDHHTGNHPLVPRTKSRTWYHWYCYWLALCLACDSKYPIWSTHYRRYQ